MVRTKITYDEAFKIFESKNCKLLYSENEFNNIYKNCNSKLSYTASCGHLNNIKLRIFKAGTGKICPTCVYKERSKKLKSIQSKENKITNMVLESNAINYLICNLKNTFDIIKTFDSCKCDIIVKPTNILDDLWLGIQVKSTHNFIENKYYFNIKKEYKDSVIICISYHDKKLWGFENDNLKHLKNTLQICCNSKSKYNQFELNINTLNEYLLNKYYKLNKFNKEHLLNQLSKTTIVEYYYRNLRINKINFLNFIENEIQGEVFDFKICDKKVQEKVTSKNKKWNYYDFNLSKCDGRGNKKIPYQIGDNDFYWFNCKDTSFFYVIPEKILIDQGFIKNKTSIIISNENKNKLWLNEYCFDYDNLDKDKLCKIIL